MAAFAGLKLDLPEHYVHFEDNKKPEYLSKFPHGKIPAFEGKDGFLLTESYAIARYGESILSWMAICAGFVAGIIFLCQMSFHDEKIYHFSYPCLNPTCRKLNNISEISYVRKLLVIKAIDTPFLPQLHPSPPTLGC